MTQDDDVDEKEARWGGQGRMASPRRPGSGREVATPLGGPGREAPACRSSSGRAVSWSYCGP